MDRNFRNVEDENKRQSLYEDLTRSPSSSVKQNDAFVASSPQSSLVGVARTVPPSDVDDPRRRKVDESSLSRVGVDAYSNKYDSLPERIVRHYERSHHPRHGHNHTSKREGHSSATDLFDDFESCSSCEDTERDESSLITTNSSELTTTASSSTTGSIQQENWDADVQPNGELFFISCFFNYKMFNNYHADSGDEDQQLLNKIQQKQQEDNQFRVDKAVTNSSNSIIKLIRKKSMSKTKKSKLNIELPSTVLSSNQSKKLTHIPFGKPKEFLVHLTANLNLGRRASLSEIKLGLVLCTEPNNCLRVVELVPDSNVYNCKLIGVNDLLMSVNDVHVNGDNVYDVLSALSLDKEVKLRVQETRNKHELNRNRNNYKSKIVNEILYGLEGVSGSDKSDVCLIFAKNNELSYKYPAHKNNLSNSFGLFLTLNNLFNNSSIYCSTSSVECESFVIFSRDKINVNDFLLISYPKQYFFDYNYCLKINKLIVKCLRLSYGIPFEDVFTLSNVHGLNKLFSFLFNRLLINSNVSNDALGASSTLKLNENVSNEEYIKIFKTETLTRECSTIQRSTTNVSDVDASTRSTTSKAESSRMCTTNDSGQFDSFHNDIPNFENDIVFLFPKQLKINADLDQQINDALGELEANDTYEDSVKNFIVIGTCLFYKNYLLASHMNNKDLIAVYCLLTCNGLLYLNKYEKNVKNIIMWKQIYIKQTPNLYYNNKLKLNNKYYLLIYGKNNYLLCTLLESNYFTNVLTSNVQPDVKLIKHSEEIINFLINTKNINYLNKEIGLLNVNLNQSKDLDDLTSLMGSYQSQSTLTDDDYHSDYQRKLGHESNTLLPCKLIASDTKNVLFYYTNIDKYNGVVLVPNSIYNGDIFNKFRACCYKISKMFKNYLKFKKLNNSINSKEIKLNKSIICIKEFGMCFQCRQDRYWTVGRLYNNMNEIYVCYFDVHDGVLSQNMIEIMFTLFPNQR